MPQIQWAINSYVAHSKPLSAQQLVNFYAEATPNDAKSPVIIYGTPGIKSFADNVGDGPIRGAEVMGGVLYVLSGSVLYSVDEAGKATSLGSIESAASAGASASFEITGGSVSAGVNTISSIAINGVELLSSAIDFTTDVSTTAALVVVQINTSTGYAAVSVAGTVTVTAVATGIGSNGYQVAITVTGDVTVAETICTLSGGYTMPAIIETTGGGGIPLTNPDCVSMSHNDADPSQLVIVDGTNGWIYDTTNGLRQITDEDFFSADVVDFQDQYFIFNRAGTGQWFLSNLNDGTAYTATDIATAEGDPDILVSLISQRRELWLFGAKTIEIWYNVGSGSPPFSRFEGGFIERGCAAAFSVAEDDNSIFWLGEDLIFYRADGYQPVRISQHGIEEALRKYAVTDDACAFIYTMAGHKFYVVTFPAEDHTWVYDIATKLWHERQSFGMGRWRVSTYANVYGKHLVGDFEHGRIGELDLDTYQEWGVTMQGLATGSVIHADRTRVSHRRFELDIESGVGLTTGQGSDPQIWLEWSDDGGRTWSARKPFRAMGKIGEYLQRLRWNRMGSARERIYRVVVSDPVKRSIIAAHLNVRQGRA